MHFGIDYGSKLAGTTVVTYNQGHALLQQSSVKKQDSDDMIIKMVENMQPKDIFIDAPLSLPNAYFGKGQDFFYRACDKELKAMSPMFLGGLTARAMKLKNKIEQSEIKVYETYPGALVRNLSQLESVYDKKAKSISQALKNEVVCLLEEFTLDVFPQNMHQLDSLLAWYSGYRHYQGKAQNVGNPEEGVIIY
ncbi:MAG: DUF429 domain-containing protein [Saprospiraceae bacterium]|nr:DUF429 domain-containing protein [Saprospiraceae bacterium]